MPSKLLRRSRGFARSADLAQILLVGARAVPHSRIEASDAFPRETRMV